MMNMFGISPIQLVVWAGMAASLLFWVMSVYAAWDFFSRRRRGDDIAAEWTPAVTILKPLKGLDPDLRDNLVGFCEQDYPRFQILFGVADPEDPAVEIVRDLERRYPHVDIDLVVDGRIHGTNYKVSNLINMYRRAKHDVLALSDSDIRVPRDYLRRIVAPLRDEKVGMVSCLYRAVAAGGLSSRLETLFVNTDFCHQILVARKVEKPAYAFGASMAFRRRTLEEIGGFEILADLLADDFYLGHHVASRRYTMWLSACVVETVLDLGSWKRLYQHQMRWARTYRSCRPGGYFGTIFTHGVLWSVLNLAVAGLGALPITLSMGLLATRMTTAAHLSWRYFGTNLSFGSLFLVLVKDLLLSVIWVLSFFGNTVWWSGRRFRLLRDGTMELVEVEEGAEAVGARALLEGP